jgi:primosomal protein N' (replication factor Y)
VVSVSNEGKAHDEAVRVGRSLAEEASRLGVPDVQVIGPAPSFIARLRGRYRWHIVLAGAGGRRVLDAISLGPEWSVDVDPMDTL